MVATEDGIFEVRSVRRIPVEKRWSEDNIKWVKWAPWHRYKGAEDADGEVPEGVAPEERLEVNPSGGTIVIETKEKVPRDFQIRKSDVDKHGITRGCGGCSSWFRGLARQPHNEKCRARFRELLKEEARVRNQGVRRKITI